MKIRADRVMFLGRSIPSRGDSSVEVLELEWA